MATIRRSPATISYQDVRWSKLASPPEMSNLPLQLPLEALQGYPDMAGRSGDLLILQVRSANGEKSARQRSLRSLGLRGIRSSVVRSSQDSNVIGYINAVRDLISIIELNGVLYRSAQMQTVNTDLEYERIEFGTNTRPGTLIRNSEGQYFVFQSDRRGFFASWATPLSVTESYAVLAATVDGRDYSIQGDESDEELLSDLVEDYSLDPELTVVDAPTAEALSIVEKYENSIVSAKLGFAGLNLNWHRQYERFVDSKIGFREVGIYSRDLSTLPDLRLFARRSGYQHFFDATSITVLVRERGNPKRIAI